MSENDQTVRILIVITASGTPTGLFKTAYDSEWGLGAVLFQGRWLCSWAAALEGEAGTKR
jgi:hypothetical protein